MTTLPVQTDDKWLATAYNSLAKCGDKELHRKARIAMVGFQWCGATCTAREATAVTCARQICSSSRRTLMIVACVWLALL